jgi:RNA polymerase sigma factor (sigma-70 family)
MPDTGRGRLSAVVSGGDDDVAGLVAAAAAGDPSAWEALVRRFSGLVWSVARAMGLDAADAADVSQTAWLRLAEHLGRLREPDRVGAWLAVTARREALRTRQRGERIVLDSWCGDGPDDGGDLDRALLRDERDALLWRTFADLSEPCKALLRVLLTDPPPSYVEVGEALAMPVGSIGPRRQRCLRALRKQFDDAAGALR